MPVMTGQNLVCRFSQETTWGSSTGLTSASTSWPPFETAEFEPIKEVRQLENINANAGVSDVAFSREFAQGRIRSIMDYDNFVIPLQNLFGSVTQSTSNSGFTHDFEPKNALPTGVNMGFDHTEASAPEYEIMGGKITRGTFSISAEDGVRCEFQIFGKTAADLSAGRFTSGQSTAELITSDDVTAINIWGDTTRCVRDMSWTIEQLLDTDQFCIGSGGVLTTEPGRSGPRRITIEATVALEDDTYLFEIFDSKLKGQLRLITIGDSASGSLTLLNSFDLHAQNCVMTSYSHSADGPGRMFARITCTALLQSGGGIELALSLQGGLGPTVV